RPADGRSQIVPGPVRGDPYIEVAAERRIPQVNGGRPPVLAERLGKRFEALQSLLIHASFRRAASRLRDTGARNSLKFKDSLAFASMHDRHRICLDCD